MEELRSVDVSAGIPQGVIRSLNNTIMDGSPSVTMEVLNQRIDDLTQDNCNDQFMSTGIRTEIGELQERINQAGSFPGVILNRPIAKSSRTMVGEIKARELEIVRKGIDGLERQIKQYTGVYISKDQVDIVLIKKCKTTISQL